MAVPRPSSACGLDERHTHVGYAGTDIAGLCFAKWPIYSAVALLPAISPDTTEQMNTTMQSSIIATHFPVRITRPRLFVAASATLLIVLALGTSIGVLYNQLTDTRAALADTQAQLSSTSAVLADSQTQLSSTQADLASVQSTLADTQADRDARAVQIDTLNANLAQLTSQRDGVQAQLTQTQADLQSARANLNTTSAQRDRAQSNSQDLAQAGLLMNNTMKASSDYNKVVQLQLNDLNSALNAAVRYDWITERVYVAQYQARLSDQWDKSSAVYQSTDKLQTWMKAHPSAFAS